jgi:hypothetical protein
MPLERGLRSINTNIEIVFITVRNLRGVDDSLYPLCETNKAIAVVIELTARNESC